MSSIREQTQGKYKQGLVSTHLVIHTHKHILTINISKLIHLAYTYALVLNIQDMLTHGKTIH